MASLDFMTSGDVASSMRRINEIIGCGIFNAGNEKHPLFASAVTELLIHAADLCAKAAKYAARVDFKDEIDPKTKLGIDDVTDLLSKLRAAVCHVGSGHHMVSNEREIKASFVIQHGSGIFMQTGDIVLRSDYPDEMTLYFGNLRVYLKRHIIRACNEAWAQLSPVMDPMFRSI